MPLSPFHRTALTTVLSLVAATMIVTGAPPMDAVASSAQATVVPPLLAAMLPSAQKAQA
jgi:hypothetical protein